MRSSCVLFLCVLFSAQQHKYFKLFDSNWESHRFLISLNGVNLDVYVYGPDPGPYPGGSTPGAPGQTARVAQGHVVRDLNFPDVKILSQLAASLLAIELF